MSRSSRVNAPNRASLLLRTEHSRSRTCQITKNFESRPHEGDSQELHRAARVL
jgi:hypothetical protein